MLRAAIKSIARHSTLTAFLCRTSVLWVAKLKLAKMFFAGIEPAIQAHIIAHHSSPRFVALWLHWETLEACGKPCQRKAWEIWETWKPAGSGKAKRVQRVPLRHTCQQAELLRLARADLGREHVWLGKTSGSCGVRTHALRTGA